MRIKQYAKACKREIQKPVHGDNLPGHAEQGRSFDVEPRANLRNLREDSLKRVYFSQACLLCKKLINLNEKNKSTPRLNY
jgi:hypothetical protein